MPGKQGHQWFAAFWDWQTRHEPPSVRLWRQGAAGGARGRVLEIGCGSGANFEYYGDSATSIVATEPDPYMLRRARARAQSLARPIKVDEASAEALPFEEASFDTVVSTANMCSIPKPARALAEVRRVLKPAGEYRFFDHVRYDNSIGGFFQDVATPVWKWCGAGCHPNRNIEQLMRDAGLNVAQLDHVTAVPPIPPFIIVRPCIRGVAIRA